MEHKCKSKTLIILDWDDTLFPTSWLIKNNINLLDTENRWRYISLFTDLDLVLSNLIQKLKQYGKVVIITNAMPDWINNSLSVLPKTSKSLQLVSIVSARKLFQGQFNDMDEWKKRTFKTVVAQEFHNKKLMNIISIGDAEYEYRALIDLYNWQLENSGENRRAKRKILKSVKLLHSPSHDALIEQLMVLLKVAPTRYYIH